MNGRGALERLNRTLRRVHMVLTLLLIATGMHLGLIAVMSSECIGA